MNSLIEDYLVEVAAHLGELPAARRTEEIREMRQHLMNTVEGHQKRGATEQEAVEATLRQFGSSSDAASGLRSVWRRGRRPWLNAVKDGFLGTIALWSSLAICTLLSQYIAERSNALTAFLSPHFQSLFYILLFGLSLLSGALLRKQFASGSAKAAVWGTVLGYVAPLVVYEIMNTGNDSDIAPLSAIILLQAACLNGVV